MALPAARTSPRSGGAADCVWTLLFCDLAFDISANFLKASRRLNASSSAFFVLFRLIFSFSFLSLGKTFLGTSVALGSAGFSTVFAFVGSLGAGLKTGDFSGRQIG